jgi:hypothetical protein
MVKRDVFPLGTRTVQGKVVRRDVTRYGLQRMCVATRDRYPDVVAWCMGLRQYGVEPSLHYYTEQVRPAFIGYLWLFWKE